MRRVEPTPEHRAFRDEAIALLKKHAGHLNALDMLALAAHLVGQIAAMQDQRTTSPSRAMEVVAANIEAGNKEILDQLSGTPAGNG